jgi:hypothetical protein
LVTHAFEWLSHFKCEETSVEDFEHSGRPFTGHTDKNMDKVHKIVTNGGLEHAVELHKVRASVANQ